MRKRAGVQEVAGVLEGRGIVELDDETGEARVLLGVVEPEDALAVVRGGELGARGRGLAVEREEAASEAVTSGVVEPAQDQTAAIHDRRGPSVAPGGGTAGC